MLFIEKKFVYEEIDFEEESWMNEKKNKRRRKSLRNRRVKKKLRKVQCYRKLKKIKNKDIHEFKAIM